VKKSVMILTSLVLTAALGSTAAAITVNPAEWSFVLETYDATASASWTSPSVVDSGFPQYDYTWELTEAKLWVKFPMLPQPTWVSILSNVEPKSGSDTATEYPFDVFTIQLGSPETPGITADISFYVDEGGYGQATMGDMIFGRVDGGTVKGIRVSGNVTVTGVPEPATVLLLGLSGMVFLIKRRA